MSASSGIAGKAAICGIGMTEIGKFPNKTPLHLAVDAFKLALDDAGLTNKDVDGLIMLSFGADYDRFLEATGVNSVYTRQGWTHGRFIAPMLQEAAMVVAAGLANYVAIVHGRSGKHYGNSADLEMWRQGLGPHGETAAYGAMLPAYGVALSAQRYFHMYGGDNAALAPIAVSFRNNAQKNPRSMYYNKPLSIEDHQSSRWIVEPLRLYDCCQINDGGTCIIVTSAERAKDLRKDPVYMMGMQGVHAGPDYHNFALPGLGVAQQEVYTYQPDDLRVYELSDIKQSDIDGMSLYDAFSPLVLFALERFGFCGPGEAMDFVKGGRIEADGEFPMNTSGGLLSEGHLAGWNIWIEIVRQLRHEAEERQVPDAEIWQWAGFLGESIIFRR